MSCPVFPHFLDLEKTLSEFKYNELVSHFVGKGVEGFGEKESTLLKSVVSIGQELPLQRLMDHGRTTLRGET